MIPDPFEFHLSNNDLCFQMNFYQLHYNIELVLLHYSKRMILVSRNLSVLVELADQMKENCHLELFRIS